MATTITRDNRVLVSDSRLCLTGCKARLEKFAAQQPSWQDASCLKLIIKAGSPRPSGPIPYQAGEVSYLQRLDSVIQSLGYQPRVTAWVCLGQPFLVYLQPYLLSSPTTTNEFISDITIGLTGQLQVYRYTDQYQVNLLAGNYSVVQTALMGSTMTDMYQVTILTNQYTCSY